MRLNRSMRSIRACALLVLTVSVSRPKVLETLDVATHPLFSVGQGGVDLQQVCVTSRGQQRVGSLLQERVQNSTQSRTSFQLGFLGYQVDHCPGRTENSAGFGFWTGLKLNSFKLIQRGRITKMCFSDICPPGSLQHTAL